MAQEDRATATQGLGDKSVKNGLYDEAVPACQWYPCYSAGSIQDDSLDGGEDPDSVIFQMLCRLRSRMTAWMGVRIQTQ